MVVKIDCLSMSYFLGERVCRYGRTTLIIGFTRSHARLALSNRRFCSYATRYVTLRYVLAKSPGPPRMLCDDQTVIAQIPAWRDSLRFRSFRSCSACVLKENATKRTYSLAKTRRILQQKADDQHHPPPANDLQSRFKGKLTTFDLVLTDIGRKTVS